MTIGFVQKARLRTSLFWPRRQDVALAPAPSESRRFAAYSVFQKGWGLRQPGMNPRPVSRALNQECRVSCRT
jgi:hypothetical protein